LVKLLLSSFPFVDAQALDETLLGFRGLGDDFISDYQRR
jgi:hypothetical protein